MIETETKIRQYILIAVETGRAPLSAEASLDELRSLLETAGGAEAGRMIQPLEAPSARSYFGSGKIEELKELLQETNADGVIADDELSPAQLRNLGDLLDTQILDRTTLILEIFAMRANTREGQLQVSLAQLSYQVSHLVGFGLSLSRLGGGGLGIAKDALAFVSQRLGKQAQLCGFPRAVKAFEDDKCVHSMILYSLLSCVVIAVSA